MIFTATWKPSGAVDEDFVHPHAGAPQAEEEKSRHEPGHDPGRNLAARSMVRGISARMPAAPAARPRRVAAPGGQRVVGERRGSGVGAIASSASGEEAAAAGARGIG